jgi:hypothetical protein
MCVIAAAVDGNQILITMFCEALFVDMTVAAEEKPFQFSGDEAIND